MKEYEKKIKKCPKRNGLINGGEVGVIMYTKGRKWVLNSLLFAGDTGSFQKIKGSYKVWSVFFIVYVKGDS